MKLVEKKLLIMMLMLAAFVGQALAGSTISCVHESVNNDMPMMTHVQSLNMSHAKATLVDEEQGMDCCQVKCQCPMSGCITASLLFNYSFSSSVIVEQKIVQLSLLHQSQISASLYRPPIS